MERNSKEWKDLLDQKEGDKRIFFVQCRFIFCATTLVSLVAFIAWLEMKWGFYEVLHEYLD